MIVGVVLWQLGVFNVGQGSIVTTGWSKLQPLSPSIVYKADGSFETTFTNTVGTSIKVDYVNVTEMLSTTECTATSITVNSVAIQADGTPTTPVSIKAGDPLDMAIAAAGCPTSNDGDPFDMLVTVQYTSVMGGVSTSHTESGRIRGPVEA